MKFFLRLKSNELVRSKSSKFVWIWNKETEEYEIFENDNIPEHVLSYMDWKEFYKRYPDKLIENYSGHKLKLYQRLILRLFTKLN